MRVAVLYPFPNLRQASSGNSVRVGLFLRYWEELGASVTALSPGVASQTETVGSITFQSFRWPFWPKVPLRLRCWLARLRGGPEFEAEVRLRHAFHNYKTVRAFWHLARAVIEASEVVFLEYAFWAAAVTALCREARKPLILTVHDVLSVSGGRTQAGRAELLKMEVAAMQQAGRAACVSPEDLSFWQSYRKDVGCFLNPIDIERCRPVAQSDRLADFRARHQLDQRPIFAFVGSAHLPNRQAVLVLERLARVMPEAQFVVAGSCATRGAGLLRRMGVISAEDLRCLYTLATAMVMPLPYGTGTSVKFLEALAYGQAIVASPVAARGYGARSGWHALIESSSDGFIHHLRTLIADPLLRRTLGDRARELAKRYDYRLVFQGYREWLPDTVSLARLAKGGVA